MPKIVPVAKKRDWLARAENGEPLSKLADEEKCRVSAIKRGIGWAKADRDSLKIQLDFKSRAFERHQHQLLETIDQLLSVLKTPAFSIVSDKLPRIISGGRIVNGSGQQPHVLVFDPENAPMWSYLIEHIGKEHGNRMKIDKAKKAIVALVQTRHDFVTVYRSSLSPAEDAGAETTGNSSERAEERKRLAGNTLSALYQAVIAAVDTSDTTFVNDLVVKGDRLEYVHGITLMDGVNAGRYKTLVREVFNDLVLSKSNKDSSLAKAIEAEKATDLACGEAYEAVNEYKLLGYVPGKCGLCERLGV
jgi:hypothetical protein